jgi:ectoine hydroxylase
MTFTDEQIAEFNAQGYLIARGLFSAEEMRLLIETARADGEFDKAESHKDAEGGSSRLQLKDRCGDDIYSVYVRARRIVDNMERLLGDEVYHWHHKMMLKEPRVGGAWEWHQDYGYWYRLNHCLYPDMASCAIAVDRAGRHNGCMQLIAGSHRCGRIEHGQSGEQVGADMERVNALLERLPLVYAELEPGDALFFHSNTLHRSDANRSEHPRWTLIGCYNTKHNDPYRQPSGHPAYHPLEKLDDARVLPMARAYWEQAVGAKSV